MKNNFNLIAPVYDGLVKVIFGSKLKQIQAQFLPLIPENAGVLIMGGGTGWIINELFNTGFKGRLTYVEASEKMIFLSKRNCEFSDSIDFIHGEESDLPVDRKYDVIITNFFLDVFSKTRLDQVITILSEKLNEGGGLWICSDFYDTGKTSHRFLLWLMLSFFRITTQLESKQLIDFHPKLEKEGYLRKQHFQMMNGLVFSSIYTNAR
ncbi:class I SAM-dependent methyltransferase [Roseivirga echinicomitans]|uniref:Methyltransferase domain-containing protein n=1 Tax=Roseivirga echinicomitans TaxID=296218 RepID=A0A150XYF6_9BACT|nr:class I SAM-dependent methyltransferase [Roseivirga echinicomitans]KYG83809.1 hypothetical protein AWN68_03110 [Roseivirga echinicomitans]